MGGGSATFGCPPAARIPCLGVTVTIGRAPTPIGSPGGGHAPALPHPAPPTGQRRGRGGQRGPGPALVPQAVLEPTETHESNERTERAEQRKQENPSTRTTTNTYKIYAESFKGADHLKQVQNEATALVNDILSN